MENLFKNKQLRVTKQRSEVIDAVRKLQELATLKNIVTKCSDVDQSTVYRIVDLLVAKNIFEKRVNYDEEIYYAIKEEHGHYFTCVKCHKREEITDCPLETLEQKFEQEKGYEILEHTVLINGICDECKEKV